MVSNGGEWVIGVRKMSSDEGRWVIGVREMSYDTSKWAARVREMFFDGGYGPTGAALGMYFPTFFLSSFLSLMKEKRAKENQAPTGGGEVGRVQEGAGVVFSEVGRVREEAGVVFSEIGRVRDGAGVVFSEVGWVRKGADVVFSNWGGRAKKSPPNVLTGATYGWWRTTEWITWATLPRGLSDRKWRGGCKAKWWPKCRSAWALPR